MAKVKSVYAKAGVNIDKGNKAVKKIKEMVKKLGIKEIGKFSGFFTGILCRWCGNQTESRFYDGKT